MSASRKQAGLPILDEAGRLVIEGIKQARRAGTRVLKMIHGLVLAVGPLGETTASLLGASVLRFRGGEPTLAIRRNNNTSGPSIQSVEAIDRLGLSITNMLFIVVTCITGSVPRWPKALARHKTAIL